MTGSVNFSEWPQLAEYLTASEKAELLALLERQQFLIEAQELSCDLRKFVTAAWPILEHDTPLSWNWHLDLICEHLTIIKEGRFKEVFGHDCEGIIFNVPPRTMKSLLITVFFPVWLWTSLPSMRFMCVSYADELSTDHSVARRNVIDSPWYQQRWSHVFKFAKDQNLKTKYHNSARGVMFATAMKSVATGMGGNILIFDDPLNPRQAISETERNRVNTDYDQVFRSRSNDPAKAIRIIVMQRLHEEDLTGHVRGPSGKGWVHVKLADVAEEDATITFPISGRVVTRKRNESILKYINGETDVITGDESESMLWPERLTKEFLRSMHGTPGKPGMGDWGYAGQYRQNPAPLEGGLIKKAWIKYYRDLPERFDFICQSWDCTFKGKEEADFVAGQVWGKVGTRYLMLPWRTFERMDFGPTKAAIKARTAALEGQHLYAHAVLVEDKANGPAIISELQQEITGIIAVNPQGDKYSRAQSISPLWEARNVELPDPQAFDVPWLEEYIHNICVFPKAAHDDDMDATSQALIYMRQNCGDLGVWMRAYGVGTKSPEHDVKSSRTAIDDLPNIQDIVSRTRQATDFLVAADINPAGVDKTLNLLGPAALVQNSAGYLKVEGCYVMRVFGDPGYIAFAVEHQGYCKIVRQLENLA